MTKRKKNIRENKKKLLSLESLNEQITGKTIRIDNDDLKVLNLIGDILDLPLKSVLKHLIMTSLANDDFRNELEQRGEFNEEIVTDFLNSNVKNEIENQDLNSLVKQFKEENEEDNQINIAFNYLKKLINSKLKESSHQLNYQTLVYLYPERILDVFHPFYSALSSYDEVELKTLEIQFLTALAWIHDETLVLTSLQHKNYPEIIDVLKNELESCKESYFYFQNLFISQYEYFEEEEFLDNYNIKPILEFIKEKYKKNDYPQINKEALINCYKNALAFSKQKMLDQL